MLTPEATSILQLLVNFIRQGRFFPHDEQSFMGYKEAHDYVGLQRKGPHWGNSLRVQGLEDLAKWCLQNEVPAITGLIVDQTNFRPGNGYFEVYGRPLDDRDWWAEQVRGAIAFEWSSYVYDDATPTLDELLAFSHAVLEGAVMRVSNEIRFRCETLRKRARQY